MMSKAFSVSIDKVGVAKISFDLVGESVNKLSRAVLLELEERLNVLKRDSKTKALTIVSGKKDIFIAGADIQEICQITSPEDGAKKARIGQSILNKIVDLPFPSIAIIDGACLGGGLELALACRFRICTDNPKTLLGLPEVTLGIIPGFGGTQRLHRLIGLREGLSMILSGKPVKGAKAYKLGLCDAFISKNSLEEKIGNFVDQACCGKSRKKILARRPANKFRTSILENNPISKHFIFEIAKKNLFKKVKDHYPAPVKALAVIRNTYSLPLDQGLQMEAVTFGQLATSTVCRNLIGLYFTREKLKKDSGTNEPIEVTPILKGAVVGVDSIGGEIGWLFSKAQLPVYLKDFNWETVNKAYKISAQIYEKLRSLKKFNDQEIAERMQVITKTIDYKDFNNLDMVIESTFEEPKKKIELLKEVEKNTRKDVIIASTTSTLPLGEIEPELSNPENFIGLHFFDPVSRNPLVEVIPGTKTSPKTIQTVVTLAKKLGKTPIVVQNCPGFLVNRILFAYLNESLVLLQEGIDPQKIDKVFTSFGMQTGPLSLLDEIGVDTGYETLRILQDTYQPRIKMAGILAVLYTDYQLLGKKGKKGIYLYEGKKKRANPDLVGIIEKCQRKENEKPISMSENDILDRILLLMVNEATFCIQEAVIANPNYLDMAMIMGIGFPPFQGGLLRFADRYGMKSVVAKLENLSIKHGDRFNPSNLLIRKKEKGETFYNNEIAGGNAGATLD